MNERAWLHLVTAGQRSGVWHVVPVRGERSQGEHGHPHGAELDEGDEFAAEPTEQPPVQQVPAGVHRGARDQQQHVPQSQAGQEQVGHRAHGLHQQARLHQGHVPHQTHEDDDAIDHRDPDAGDPEGALLLRRVTPDPPGDIKKSHAVLRG